MQRLIIRLTSWSTHADLKGLRPTVTNQCSAGLFGHLATALDSRTGIGNRNHLVVNDVNRSDSEGFTARSRSFRRFGYACEVRLSDAYLCASPVILQARARASGD